MSLINIVRMYNLSDKCDREEGLVAYDRYGEMMRKIANFYGWPVDLVTAAFCDLSPNNDYIGNLRSLVSVLDGLNRGVPHEDITVSTYKHCRKRAIEHLLEESPFVSDKRGLKILNFYNNIMYPMNPNYITIDGHMVAAYRNKKDMTMVQAGINRESYKVIADDCKEFAKSLGLLPNQLQATIWFTRKRLYKIKYNGQDDMFRSTSDKWGLLVPLGEIRPYA